MRAKNIVSEKYSIYMQLRQEHTVQNTASREYSIYIQQTKVFDIEYNFKKAFYIRAKHIVQNTISRKYSIYMQQAKVLNIEYSSKRVFYIYAIEQKYTAENTALKEYSKVYIYIKQHVVNIVRLLLLVQQTNTKQLNNSLI